MGRGKAKDDAKKGDSTKEDAPSYEASVERLRAIVERLEQGDLSLEESLALYEEGAKLRVAAEARLNAAEKRVEELLNIDENDQPVVRELEPD